MSAKTKEKEIETDLPAWFSMIEALRDGPGWASDDLPIEIVQIHGRLNHQIA